MSPKWLAILYPQGLMATLHPQTSYTESTHTHTRVIECLELGQIAQLEPMYA